MRNWQKFLTEKRLNRLLWMFALITVLLIVANYTNVSYYITAPGVALPLQRIITVEDGAKDAVGAFYLTAVSSKQANLFSFWLINLFQPKGLELSPKEETIPEGIEMNEYIRYMEEMMKESQEYAKIIALQEMGYQTQISGQGAEISDILKTSKAKEILKPGDVIIKVNGDPVELASDAVRLIKSYHNGQVLTLTVKRDSQVIDLDVETIESSDDPEKASIGILIFTHHREVTFPLEINISTNKIIGPSAGMMFTLEIINQLHPEDLTRGYSIAGTGTINPDGSVGSISGVTQKVLASEREGVDFFLTSPENYPTATKTATKLKVIEISTIAEAVEFLLDLREKEKVA